MEYYNLWYSWSPWLNSVSSSWDKVLHLGVKKHFQKNSIVIHSGVITNELHYLYKGEIKMTSPSINGEEKTIWYVTSGNVFGEVPFINCKKSYSVMTAVNDCIIYTFSREVLIEKIMPKYPEIVINILNTMANKLSILVAQVNDLSLNNPHLRVYKMLYCLACQQEDDTINISQKEMANLLGMHRVTLNSIFSLLKNMEVIKNNSQKKNNCHS